MSDNVISEVQWKWNWILNINSRNDNKSKVCLILRYALQYKTFLRPNRINSSQSKHLAKISIYYKLIWKQNSSMFFCCALKSVYKEKSCKLYISTLYMKKRAVFSPGKKRIRFSNSNLFIDWFFPLSCSSLLFVVLHFSFSLYSFLSLSLSLSLSLFLSFFLSFFLSLSLYLYLCKDLFN